MLNRKKMKISLSFFSISLFTALFSLMIFSQFIVFSPFVNSLIWLEGTLLSQSVRINPWFYPISEVVHILGLAILTGSTALFDLRLLGYGKFLSVKKTADFLLPLAHLGFFLVVLSGTFLFLNDPRALMNNTAFQIKILLILLAGINAFVFHVRNLKCAEIEIKEFSSVKAAAICSIFLWIAIIALGRFVAYI
ncbi:MULTISPECIES: DUF6644 family protein [Bacillus]|nr:MULTISPECIES: DUF6644 family protein [Bacillus]MBP1081404.1 hypothetical protein [Bacillus capparidis]MED1096076.1 hypothetical protein [Bacillus capparidis]